MEHGDEFEGFLTSKWRVFVDSELRWSLEATAESNTIFSCDTIGNRHINYCISAYYSSIVRSTLYCVLYFPFPVNWMWYRVALQEQFFHEFGDAMASPPLDLPLYLSWTWRENETVFF